MTIVACEFDNVNISYVNFEIKDLCNGRSVVMGFILYMYIHMYNEGELHVLSPLNLGSKSSFELKSEFKRSHSLKVKKMLT